MKLYRESQADVVCGKQLWVVLYGVGVVKCLCSGGEGVRLCGGLVYINIVFIVCTWLFLCL